MICKHKICAGERRFAYWLPDTKNDNIHHLHQLMNEYQMKRATITLPDDLEQAMARYTLDQEVPPSITSLVQAALRKYLAARGYIPPAYGLTITPADQGSGHKDTSVNHDQALTDE